jgi:hypothetical protein
MSGYAGSLTMLSSNVLKLKQKQRIYSRRQTHIQDWGTSIQWEFFKQQWKNQQDFQLQHTAEENDWRLRLIKIFQDEAVLELLR